MAIGEIEGVKVGQHFNNRRELHEAGIHRPLQAGIAGRANEGAESIVLSGGYVDDEDHGDYIIYTGHGGQAYTGGPQAADQDFTRQNQALVTSCLQGLPVRVIRGAGHDSQHAPATGYRYDGLYWVDDYWKEQGRDGFQICRFRLVSSTDQRGDAPPSEKKKQGGPTGRTEVRTLRVVRDTALGKRVKELHGYRCQVCGMRLECAGGPYAEAAHIRPLGAPHDGPDVLENLLCLCPNHHVLFDHGGISIADDLSILGQNGVLREARGHNISREHLRYHRALFEF